MSIDPKVIEVLKRKVSSENQDEDISKILEDWINEIDEGKEDINEDEKIKHIIKKLNV
tara:strand:- start:3550 stop:3723 length:174 start_codon:yes stop_codon:yes gene_type:complete